MRNSEQLTCGCYVILRSVIYNRYFNESKPRLTDLNLIEDKLRFLPGISFTHPKQFLWNAKCAPCQNRHRKESLIVLSSSKLIRATESNSFRPNLFKAATICRPALHLPTIAVLRFVVGFILPRPTNLSYTNLSFWFLLLANFHNAKISAIYINSK